MPDDGKPGDGLGAELRSLDPALEPPPGAAGAGQGEPGAAGATDGDRSAAMGLSAMVVAILAAGIARRWPATAYTAEEKESLSLVLCPVLLKYGLTAAWLEKYRAEAALLGTLLMLAKTGMDRVTAAAPAAPGPSPEGAVPVG